MQQSWKANKSDYVRELVDLLRECQTNNYTMIREATIAKSSLQGDCAQATVSPATVPYDTHQQMEETK